MTEHEILKRCDHTLLKPECTWAQIQALCDDGIRFKCASVCIPAAYVRQANEYVGDQLKICTVIGFPNGYSTTAVKVFEAEDAIRNGAEEIDMVVNVGWVKDRRWDDILAELKAVKLACQGHILKVIIEACLLTDEEKIKLCQLVSQSGADFIKTSTGFGSGGATREDVKLLRSHVAPTVKVKAAGGIRTLQDAEDFIKLGADRLGTSAVVKLVKGLHPEGY